MTTWLTLCLPCCDDHLARSVCPRALLRSSPQISLMFLLHLSLTTLQTCFWSMLQDSIHAILSSWSILPLEHETANAPVSFRLCLTAVLRRNLCWVKPKIAVFPCSHTPPSCGSLDLAYTTGGVSLFEVHKSRSIRFQNFCILIWGRLCFEIVSYFVVQLFSDWAVFFVPEMIPPCTALEYLCNKKSKLWNPPRILEHCFGTNRISGLREFYVYRPCTPTWIHVCTLFVFPLLLG